MHLLSILSIPVPSCFFIQIHKPLMLSHLGYSEAHSRFYVLVSFNVCWQRMDTHAPYIPLQRYCGVMTTFHNFIYVHHNHIHVNASLLCSSGWMKTSDLFNLLIQEQILFLWGGCCSSLCQNLCPKPLQKLAEFLRVFNCSPILLLSALNTFRHCGGIRHCAEPSHGWTHLLFTEEEAKSHQL